MQYQFWEKYICNINRLSMLKRIIIFEDTKINYHLIETYLEQFKITGLLDISRVYTGKQNFYYTRKLVSTINFLKFKEAYFSGNTR